jgi:hypothetical protein
MDILVKHEGDNITSSVLSYEREHKICTGVGTITLEIERTIGRTFDPWDSIDIHENGDLKVTYYISSVRDSLPEGKIIVDAQDLSKKLVDYFIPESFTIETPSYTRTWMELFLDMAGVDYDFQTDSPGNLLSNHTQLGLTTVYEQMQVLLQLSGWYMFFDGSGTCVIGPLNADLADDTNSVDREDILSISANSDDRMLRNRALVLGAFDPYSLSYAVADLTVRTTWNYDSRDIRTMVVYNSNIPNVASAMSIANLLLKEFARITVEKRIELHGARDYNLGDACRVESTVWKGKGLITTFGVRMSKDGLITDVVLDERCPRLFGFFDFGDWVYVGTYGDGVWRKHLRFDHTWNNFSTGLTNLEITDLHINHGILGSIGSMGEMYWASDAGSWAPVTVTGLASSAENIVASGSPTMIGFSGIHGRAIIIDKMSNNVKYGVDTWSGLNFGDYFMTYSSFASASAFSGVAMSGTHRGWIIEYDPYGGGLVGEYPIHYSGNYDIMVLDLENDGKNDYVSVRQGGAGVENGAEGYNLGIYGTGPIFDTVDSRATSLQPAEFPYTVRKANVICTTSDPRAITFVDNGVTGERCVVHAGLHGGILSLRRTVYSLSELGNVTTSTTTKALDAGALSNILSVYRMGATVYRLYTYQISGTGLSAGIVVNYVEWNVISNTVGSWTTCHTASVPYADPTSRSVVIGDTGHILIVAYLDFVTAGGFNVNPVTFQLYTCTMGLSTGTGSTVKTFELITEETSLGSGIYEYIRGPGGNGAGDKSSAGIVVDIFQDGDAGTQVIGWFSYGYLSVTPMKEVIITGSATSLSANQLYEDMIPRFDQIGGTGDVLDTSSSQLTRNIGVIVMEGSYNGGGGGPGEGNGFAFNGGVFAILDTGDVPFYLQATNIFPIYMTTGQHCIAWDPDSELFYVIDANAIGIAGIISPPTGYNLKCVFSNPLYGGTRLWWLIEDTTTFQESLAVGGVNGEINTLNRLEINMGLNKRRATNIGGFFFQTPSTFNTATPTVDGDYIYFGNNQLESVGGYLVLQREGTDYNLIRQEAVPIRVDISNNAPVLTVMSGYDSFKSHYVYDSEVLEVSAVPTLSGMQVDDYRYTLLEPTYSGVTSSGLGVQYVGLFVTASGVYGFDVLTYSGAYNILFPVPSGFGNRIETSNYGLGGQYVFVTTSGDTPAFFQKDPQQYTFTSYPGLPDSRATIIRLDDMV